MLSTLSVGVSWCQHLFFPPSVNIRKALQITRVALDAFAVTNRKDVYILQDVQENGDESIFYLKSVVTLSTFPERIV